MKEDIAKGWWGVPAAKQWYCPECRKLSDVERWEEREPYCELCGSHDGRECPECGYIFDHVWNSNLCEANAR